MYYYGHEKDISINGFIRVFPCNLNNFKWCVCQSAILAHDISFVPSYDRSYVNAVNSYVNMGVFIHWNLFHRLPLPVNFIVVS